MKTMKRLLATTMLAILGALVAGAVPSAQAANDIVVQSNQAVRNFKRTDPSMKKFFNKSVGYAILPSVTTGGLGIGAQRGKGLVYAHGKLIGKTTLTQVSIGAQIGGEEFAEIVFFETNKALNDFKTGQYSMSAQAKANAAASGVAANADYQNGVAVFTQSKGGLMAAAAIGSQKFGYEGFKR
jgi:lipid-binding SYLF domain-containing protein